MNAFVDEKTSHGMAPVIEDGHSQARRGRFVSHFAFVLLLAAGGSFGYRWWSQSSPPEAHAETAPPLVTVSKPLRRLIAASSVFMGEFAPVDHVDVRAQVSGYLVKIGFKDGQYVQAGDLLFEIDQRPYEFAAQQAHAQLKAAEAALKLSDQQLSRSTDLMRSGYASREKEDQRTQEQQAAEAAVDRASAAVHSAELNLQWTRIRAPIAGRVSAHRVSIGNLVVGGESSVQTTLLTTIVSVDPIYVNFDLSEADLVAYRSRVDSISSRAEDNHSVDIALSDNSGWTRKGELDFVDNALDPSSGTIRARATVPNADHALTPGQFARIRVPTAAKSEQLLVPETALGVDQSHSLVMTVSEVGRVVSKDVELGASIGELRVVARGIGPDDRIIVKGLIHARPGGLVRPKTEQIAEPASGS